MMQTQQTKVVFCLPGRSYSNKFLINWSNLIYVLSSSGKYQIKVSNTYSSFVPFARAQCLGASVERGSNQKPFNEQIDYDVIVWIDSDIIFTVDQVIELIESSLDYPVVSGYYMMENNKHYAFVKDWDNKYFLENKSYEFMTDEKLNKFIEDTQQRYMPCAYAGMGFMAVRRGIIERLNYPWFYKELQVIPTGDPTIPDYIDMCSEDVAFCRNLIEKGIITAVMVKLNLRVGHEKCIVL